MLQSAMFNQAAAAVNTSASLTLQPTATTATSDPAVTAASQALLLQQFLSRNVNPDAPFCSTQYPSSLGNPASILPFLTAQANSVFSIASGKEGEGFAGGCVTTTCSSETGEKSTNQAGPNLPFGLDLGNGWKVVGLTSLGDATNQASKPLAAESLGGLGAVCSNADVSNIQGYTTNVSSVASPLSSEWKIVGLTSLSNSTSTEVTASSSILGDDEKTAASPIKISHFSAGIPASACISSHNSGLAGHQSCQGADTTGPVHTDRALPSLVNLAAGNSEWKIAGITTLPVHSGALTASSGMGNDTTSTHADTPNPSVIPMTSAADTSQWKVVGLTSLSSPPPPPPPPAPIAPVPVVMATASPLVAMPMPSMVMGSDEGWKVVGIMPLPQNEEASAPSLGKSQRENAAQGSDAGMKPTGTALNETWNSHLMHRALDKAVDLSANSNTAQVPHSSSLVRPRPSSMLTRNTHNRVWPTLPTPKKREDPNHPLSFLKNCSRHFRNTVLKKNTVSTMLELKRAFQSQGEEEKMVTFLGKKKVFTLDKHGHKQELFSPHRHDSRPSCHSEKGNQNLEQSAMFSGPDDKTVLADLYRGQTEVHSAGIESADSCVFEGSAVTSHDSEDGHHLSHQVRAEMSLDSCLRVIKAENGEEVMSIGAFDSDNVNLTNVDPWGVCTDEDLGQIAEMMSDRGENKISHSSSRKRKLSTPRKMVQ
ncbi:uncharacterized protein [Littorina saxatilis]|uniref:uncharacterized protein n=1 Tax=Littorina saxatilis TaxID=31220 RepID=UPI0038B57443